MYSSVECLTSVMIILGVPKLTSDQLLNLIVIPPLSPKKALHQTGKADTSTTITTVEILVTIMQKI